MYPTLVHTHTKNSAKSYFVVWYVASIVLMLLPYLARRDFANLFGRSKGKSVNIQYGFLLVHCIHHLLNSLRNFQRHFVFPFYLFETVGGCQLQCRGGNSGLHWVHLVSTVLALGEGSPGQF